MKVKKPSMLKRLKRNQKGFTLIELLVAIALTGIIGTAAAMSIHQILTGTVLSNDQNTAINQVRNAGYWISRDALTAQSVNDNPEDPKFLELTWQEWDGTPHTVYYTLEDGTLRRNYDGQETLIAQYIRPKETGVTDCHWDGETLTVNITAQVGDKTETRTFEVKPRPD